MNTKDLEYFEMICNEGSFTKAAQKLFITQPTITNSINRIERELDAVVFCRNRFNNTIKLTKAGELLKETSQKILKDLTELKSSLENINSEKIKFGVPPLISNYFLPKITEILIQKNLFEKIEFTENNSTNLIDKILNNSIDLSIIAYIDNAATKLENLNISIIKQDKFKFCVGKNHPLSTKKLIDFEDLNNETFIVLNRTYLDAQLLYKILENQNIKAKNIINAGSLSAARALIASGTGIGIMFNFSTKNFRELVSLHTEKENYLTISVALKKDSILNENQKLLYDIILSNAF